MTLTIGDYVTFAVNGYGPSFESSHPYHGIGEADRVYVFLGDIRGGGRTPALYIGDDTAPGWRLADYSTHPPTVLLGRTVGMRGWFAAERRLRAATPEQIARVHPSMRTVHDLLVGASASRATDPREITDLAEYKAFVKARVEEEASHRGWCDEVNTWLDTLGLERQREKVRYSITLTVEEEVPYNTEVEAFISQRRLMISRWRDNRTLTFSALPVLSANANTVTVERVTPPVEDAPF